MLARRWPSIANHDGAIVLSSARFTIALIPVALVWLLASGLRQDGHSFEAAVLMTRWMFPYIGFMSLVALAAGVLNHPANGIACNDDGGLAGCGTGLQSQIMLRLNPGAYRLVASGCGTGGNLTTDAHLAALAVEHGATIGSFDRDFQRFAAVDLDWLGAG